MAMLVTGYSIDSVKFDKNLKIWDKSGVSPCHLAEKMHGDLVSSDVKRFES